MPRCLHHINGRFCLWSTVVDAYVGPVMNKREALIDREVASSYEGAANRVDRAEANGCSMIPPDLLCQVEPFARPHHPLVKRGNRNEA